MVFAEVLQIVEKFNKEDLIIKEQHTRHSFSIGVFQKNVWSEKLEQHIDRRILKITTPQSRNLQKLGYEFERTVYNG